MPRFLFDRNFKLTITANNREIVVEPPFRIVFDATKSTRGSLNKLTLKIYGLGEDNRLAMVKDAEQDDKVISVELAIGYGESLGTIYKGTALTGANERSGPEIITTLDCLDGGLALANGFVNTTVKRNEVVIDALLQAMPELRKGKITEQKQLQRPKVLVGSPLRIIEESLDPDESFYIDDQQLYIIKTDDVVSSFIPKVSAETGLVNTPTRESKRVTFTTKLNPTIRAGGLVNLESQTAPHLNGIYKIDTITYNGDNYGSAWDQTCTGELRKNYTVL